MAINVIDGGTAAFNAIVYKDQHPNNRAYFENQIRSISNVTTEIGQRFFGQVKDIYDQINSSEAMRLARAALNNVKSLFQPDTIRYIKELGELQTAPHKMQRFIMACPDIREMYLKQRIDGYSESYVNLHANDVGENHYDYRRVMDGVCVDLEDGGWCANQYYDELLPGDIDLTHSEQVDILSTWDIAKMFIKAGSDPTSAWDVKL